MVTGQPKFGGGGPSALPWQREGGSGLRFFGRWTKTQFDCVDVVCVRVEKKCARRKDDEGLKKQRTWQSTRSAAIFLFT